MSDNDPWLQAKLWLFSLGALVALVGMMMENRWLVGGAGVVLAAGVLLRFVPRPSAGNEDEGGGTGSPRGS